MIRFYLLPTESMGIFSGPKYFHWRYDPDPPGIDCFWARKDYRAAPACALAADIAAKDHDTLSTLRDVYAFPFILEKEINSAERNKLTRHLAKMQIPSYWLSASDDGRVTDRDLTYREALRTITCMFLYTQALVKLGGSFFEWEGGSRTTPLQWRWCELSARQKDWIKQAAWSGGYVLDFVTVNTRVEQILKGLADQWGKKPISYKFTEI